MDLPQDRDSVNDFALKQVGTFHAQYIYVCFFGVTRRISNIRTEKPFDVGATFLIRILPAF